MTLRQPIPRVRRHQEHLLTITRQKVLAGTDMLTSAFAVAVTLGFVNFRRPLHQRSKAQCTASAAPA
jgi:hypothetical protein